MIKSMSALLQKLAELDIFVYAIAFLLFYVGGGVLLATGATGGWPQFGVAVVEPLWRDVIGVVGLVLLSVAAILTFITMKGGRQSIPDKRRFGVSIKKPLHGAGVKLPCEVTGKCKKLPKGLKLYLIVFRKDGESTLCWPQDQIDVPDGGGDWETTLHARDAKVGETRTFAMFVVGEDGQALIEHYRVAGREKSAIANTIDYPAITKTTSDMVRCADREVRVVKTETSMQMA